MPTFTAITLDRLLEPGSRNPSPKPPPPPAPARVERAVPSSIDKKKSFSRPPASPALYATPESTPLPDSPSSFPPSPYIINHKRRGPRLLKSSSQNNVGANQTVPEVGKFDAVNGQQREEVVNGIHNEKLRLEHDANVCHPEVPADGSSDDGRARPEQLDVPLASEAEREAESEDFFDPQDTMSSASNMEFDDSDGVDRSWKPSTPHGEFFDAFEEISSDGALSGCRNFDEELRDMRLNFMMEIERRKQAEEALENLQNQWQTLSHQLSLVGLTLLAPPAITEERGELPSLDPADDLCQQVIVARAVAAAVGRGSSRAEIELKMDPQIEAKNFEIARLSDRLQYYEAANREMSQRNQEAVEMARQQRLKRKRRQKWIWSSIGLAITVGAATLAWSYMPTTQPPPSGSVDAEASQEH